MGKRIEFIDLFAGIGGLRLGFEAIGGECVFTCERDRFARRTYEANFGGGHPFAEDATAVRESEIPGHGVLLAGFPCQPFSIAGVSKKNSLGRAHGFADEAQGTLFFDVVRILRHHRPKAFLCENVRNLASHDGGNTFRVIMGALEDLDYSVSHAVIDASPWVPQKRERIFIAGFRRPHPGFDFGGVERPAGPPPVLGDVLEQDPDPKYILGEATWRSLRRHAERLAAAGNGFGYGLCAPDSAARTLTARYYKDGSEILVGRGDGIPRRLTPRECSRLMGFDSPQGSAWEIPVSDTQAYRQFGNAVSPPVARAVARAMAPLI